MNLAEFQRLMAADIMRPLTRPGRIAKDNRAAEYVKPNNRLTAVERLEIYNRSYWCRILDSLREDFPGLRAVLGERAFTRLSEAYLAECPSTSFTLGNLGSKLEAWLLQYPERAGRHHPLALDMVRLEWAHIQAFDGLAKKEIGPEDLAEFNPRLTLALQPYVHLLHLQYPVDRLRLRVNAASEGQTAASNTVVREHRRPLNLKAGRLAKAPVFVAVHRNDGCVYYRRLEPGEFAVLQSLRRGGRLTTVLSRALRNSALPVTEVQSSLQGWFAAWAQLGWLCHPWGNSGKDNSGKEKTGLAGPLF
jgi:hypothetical protein